MLKARVTLKNLENLTYNFLGSDDVLAMKFNKKLTQLFDKFYSKVSQGDLLVRPVTKERVNVNTENLAVLHGKCHHCQDMLREKQRREG